MLHCAFLVKCYIYMCLPDLRTYSTCPYVTVGVSAVLTLLYGFNYVKTNYTHTVHLQYNCTAHNCFIHVQGRIVFVCTNLEVQRQN